MCVLLNSIKNGIWMIHINTLGKRCCNTTMTTMWERPLGTWISAVTLHRWSTSTYYQSIKI